jgi:diguanylate cyclase
MSDAAVQSSARSDVAGTVVCSEIKSRERDLRFVDRIHLIRTLGLGLGFFCVASVFRLHGAPPFIWVALVLDGFIWPHAAWMLARRSGAPARAEFRHLAIDSALGGMWVALMHFNLLPSVLLVTMLSVDKIAVGGMRLVLRTSLFLVAACVLTVVCAGWAIAIATPMSVVVACIPFLVAYPIAISAVMHGMSRKVAQQNRWLTRISTTDELTGLANRRQGFSAAEQALARHRRHGGAAVLVVLDVDRFKQVNDRYGHPAGDQILRRVATTLRQCCRVTDTPARYAGDEFVLVLPDTTMQGAIEMTNRFRERLAAEVFERAPGLRCTVSLGAAEAHAEMADVEDWVQQADAALYNAKTGGRDRLVSAPAVVVTQRGTSRAQERAGDSVTTGKRSPRHSAAA